MDISKKKLSVITGRYDYKLNPCVTDPCLPGMAYVVCTNEVDYYITKNGNWYLENCQWEGYMPQLNDVVRITGIILDHTDIHNEPFYTIEAVTVKKVK